MAKTTANLVKQFIDLDRKKADAEKVLEAAKAQREALEAELLKRFESAGLQSLKVDGITVYMRRELWASAKDGDKPNTIRALREAGCGELVSETYNAQQLSSYVRDCVKVYLAGNPEVKHVSCDTIEAEVVHPALRGALHVTEKFKLGTRKS